jgi:hypothetical protein
VTNWIKKLLRPSHSFETPQNNLGTIHTTSGQSHSTCIAADECGSGESNSPEDDDVWIAIEQRVLVFDPRDSGETPIPDNSN